MWFACVLTVFSEMNSLALEYRQPVPLHYVESNAVALKRPLSVAGAPA